MFYVDTYKTPLHACALFLGASKKFGDRYENRFNMNLELPPTNYPIPSLRSLSLVTYNLDRILNTYLHIRITYSYTTTVIMLVVTSISETSIISIKIFHNSHDFKRCQMSQYTCLLQQ